MVLFLLGVFLIVMFGFIIIVVFLFNNFFFCLEVKIFVIIIIIKKIMFVIKLIFFNIICFEKIKKYKEIISSKKFIIFYMVYEFMFILLINVFVYVIKNILGIIFILFIVLL